MSLQINYSAKNDTILLDAIVVVTAAAALVGFSGGCRCQFCVVFGVALNLILLVDKFAFCCLQLVVASIFAPITTTITTHHGCV